MTRCFVIHLADRAAECGVVAGQVEVVETGEVRLVSSGEELLRLLSSRPDDQRHGSSHQEEGR